MRAVLVCGAVAGLVASAPGYIHVPPQTLKEMAGESPQVRALTVRARDRATGVVVFEVADVLRAAEKSPVASFKLVLRPDADGAATVFDHLAVGKTAVLFSKEYGTGRAARGYGYAFTDAGAISIDYVAAGERWVFLRAEPSLSAVYHGPAADLPKLVKDVLAGKDVRVPTRAPAKADDYAVRGLLVDEARRKNDPAYPKAPLPTAWGKPAKGLQAGVRVNPAVEVADAALVLEVVIRNVDTKPRVFTHVQLAFPGVAAGGVATAKGEEYASRFAPKGTRLAALVSPGDAYALAAVPVFRPGAGKAWPLPRLELQPGENRVGMEGVAVRLGGGNSGEEVVLATGYLDVPGPAAAKQ